MTSPPSNEPKKVPLRIRLPFATEAEFIERYGLHVSRSTLFIATRSPKPVETVLTFELVLSDNSRLMRGEGQVQKLTEDTQQGRSGMLLRLTRVDAKTKELIDRILALRPPGLAGSGRGTPPPLAPPVTLIPTASTPTPAPPSGPAERLVPEPTPPRTPLEALGALPRWLTEPDDVGPPEPSAPPPRPSGARSPPEAPSSAEAASGTVVTDLRGPGHGRLGEPSGRGAAPGASPMAPSVSKPPPEVVLGIDLGALHARAAVFVDGAARLVPLASEDGATALPAVVAADSQGALVVGSLARGASAKQAVTGLEHLVGRRLFSRRAEVLAQRSGHRLIADERGDLAVDLGARVLFVAPALAELVGVLKREAEAMLGRSVTRAVLCAPSWYSAHQRAQVLAAATLAGLEVAALINHPSAVAMSFGFGRGLARKRVLVFDWAGEAFDASVVEITGEDLEVVCAGGAELLEPPSTEAVDGDGTKALVERAVEATRALLEGAGLQPQSLDELLLAGSHASAPAVRDALERLAGRPPRADLDAEGAAALGAALFGHSLVEKGQGKRGLALFEVLAAPIGVAVEGGGFHRVLEQNTRLPAEKTLPVPARAHAPVSLGVYQGTSAFAGDNEYLGILTSTSDRDGELEVRFSVAADGRLSLSARTPSGRPTELSFDSSAADATALAQHLSLATLGASKSTPAPPRGLLGGLKRLFGR
jgi:uncharacterized protein (TIGR02266 family)